MRPLEVEQLAGPDMMIDGYEQFNQQENDVVNISADEHSEDAAAENILRADDCKWPVRQPRDALADCYTR
jgi:hypothetical protein